MHTSIAIQVISRAYLVAQNKTNHITFALRYIINVLLVLETTAQLVLTSDAIDIQLDQGILTQDSYLSLPASNAYHCLQSDC